MHAAATEMYVLKEIHAPTGRHAHRGRFVIEATGVQVDLTLPEGEPAATKAIVLEEDGLRLAGHRRPMRLSPRDPHGADPVIPAPSQGPIVADVADLVRSVDRQALAPEVR